MFEFLELILHRRRFNLITIAVIINLLLICAVAPFVEPHGVSALANLQTSNASQNTITTSDSANAVSNGMAAAAQSANQAINSAGVKVLSTAVSVTRSVTYFDKSVGHGTTAAAGFIAVGAAKSADLAGKVVSGTYSIATYPFRHARNLMNLGSIIQPGDPTPTPTITQLRAQQAAIIQEGTKVLSVAPVNTGIGGACDAGAGNGGYPMDWCNAPMDSINTVSYTSDRINRECTSYAYWYFASIEGHSDFHVTGNAKYWANTSNYPTHTAPAVGAIAVETAGAYGHVAIVQALPGQEYDGQPVPAGYILVSEMNYDWNGHFRYSYSPTSKFSRYIYP